MAQSSGYGAGPGSVDLTAGVTGGTSGTTGTTGTTGATGGSGATDQAKDKAQQAAGQAKEQAQQVAGKAQGALRSQVDTRSTQAGEQIKSQASDIRTVGEQLRSQGKDKPAQLADQAAQRIEGIGDYLQRADADAIIDDVERFARQRPWAVLAGGLSLGFLAARALKASSTERYHAGRGTDRRQLPATAGTTNYGDGGGYGGGSYGGSAGGGSYGGSAGGGSYGGSTGGYVGGGISGTEDVTTVPPATTVPPVSTDNPRTPPAGGR